MAKQPFRTDGPIQSLIWDGSSAGTKYRAVKISGEGTCDVAIAVTDYCIGVLQNEPDATKDDGASVQYGGISFAEAGAAITAGDRVVPTTDGKFIKYVRNSTWAGPEHYSAGIAMTGATGDGKVFSLRIHPTEGVV